MIVREKEEVMAAVVAVARIQCSGGSGKVVSSAICYYSWCPPNQWPDASTTLASQYSMCCSGTTIQCSCSIEVKIAAREHFWLKSGNWHKLPTSHHWWSSNNATTSTPQWWCWWHQQSAQRASEQTATLFWTALLQHEHVDYFSIHRGQTHWSTNAIAGWLFDFLFCATPIIICTSDLLSLPQVGCFKYKATCQ